VSGKDLDLDLDLDLDVVVRYWKLKYNDYICSVVAQKIVPNDKKNPHWRRQNLGLVLRGCRGARGPKNSPSPPRVRSESGHVVFA
jgi:hypothetical protein